VRLSLKESRMEFANATELDRKSGVAQWRDLRFQFSLQLNFEMSKQDHHYYVYIAASRTHVLYCGMTDSIQRRVEEHRHSLIPGFTETYQCNRLVWFEHHQYVLNAIDREKQIKRWRRAKKIWLIEQTNPTWADLSEAWRQETAGPSTALRSGRDDKD
jgi:putative endonuclease